MNLSTSGPVRFTGLISGIDFDQLIGALLDIQRQPILRLEQERQRLAWRSELWEGIRQSLLGLQQAVEAFQGADGGLPLTGTSSDSSILKATASPEALLGRYRITVEQLARPSHVASRFAGGETAISADPSNALDPRVPLLSQNSKLRLPLAGLDEENRGSFQVNGITISFDADTDSLEEVLQRLNRSGAGVVAFYDPLADRVVMVSQQTGANSAILRADSVGNFLEAMGLSVEAQVSSGQNARLLLEAEGYPFNQGQPIERESNTISDLLPGVTLQLVRAAPGQPVEVEIAQGKEVLEGRIRAWVNAFNASVSLMGRYLTETPPPEPKTDEERKIGLLRGDGTLFSLRATLVREAVAPMATLPSEMRMLAQAGIVLHNDGTLSLDEGKFRKALESDPGRVARLFSSEEGIASRLAQRLKEWLSTTPMAFADGTLPSGIVARQPALLRLRRETLDRRIRELEERLEREGERLQRRFLALEQQLAALQQRWGNPLGGSLGTLGLHRQA